MTDSEVSQLLERVAAEVAAGQQWRAKEMLRGRISSTQEPISSSVLEAYGNLLESLGDRYEAGKFLFLSGARAPADSEAVALYLTRNHGASASLLISQFPKAVQHPGLGHLPQSVRDFLAARGADQSVLQRTTPVVRGWPRVPMRLRDRVVLALVLAVFALLLVSCGVGLVVIARWLL